MITTRDLGLREKEVQKNLNETYSTLKKQPVGGQGAMIQKPNQFQPPIKVTPTLFTPAPMSSSLPYLADDVKFRSNENLLQIVAHLQKQKEGAKASIIYDDIKQNQLNAQNDKIMNIVNKNFEANTEDMLRKYLSGAIEKSKNEERKIVEERMKRMDLEMNPVKPAENIRGLAASVLPTLTRGDMGRPDAVTQEDLREVRTARYAQPSNSVASEIEALRSMALEDRDAGRNRSMQERTSMEAEDKRSIALEDLRLREELGKYTSKKLKQVVKMIPEEFRSKIGGAVQSIPAYIEEIIKAKKSGVLSRIPYELLGAPREQASMGGGGGAALVALREGANELLQKGII
jgi:hypothetical protein